MLRFLLVVAAIAARVSVNAIELPEPEIIDDDGKVLFAELVLDVATVDIGNGDTMTTRALNGMVPGPTIKIKPGQTLIVRLINALEDDGEHDYVHNELSANNQTNLHLHGLHIDGDWPSDSVLRVVMPGESTRYYAEIVDFHLPGTHWLHPHRHGSTLLQVAGGAALAVIVEEQIYSETGLTPINVADGVDDAPEKLLVFQPIYNMDGISELYGESLFSTTKEGDFTLVNGVHHPDVAINKGQWTRMRIVNTGYDTSSLDFNFRVEGCEHMLLAKDGIYVSDFPRTITQPAYIPPGGRADIMVRCNEAGSYGITAYAFEDGPVATVVVPESDVEYEELGGLQIDVSTYADYLVDTIGKRVPRGCSCKTVVNRLTYESEDRLHKAVKGKLQERELSAGGHPYHQHVYPFQLQADFDEYYKQGDWHDVWKGDGLVRYNPTRFNGKMILHCHRLKHEDEGMMGTEQIANDGRCQCDYRVTATFSEAISRGSWNHVIIYGSLMIVAINVWIILKKRGEAPTEAQDLVGESTPLVD